MANSTTDRTQRRQSPGSAGIAQPAFDPDRPVIVVCGERYSANLGDGAISDCMIYLLRRMLPDAVIASVDLGGRRHYPGLSRKQKPEKHPFPKLRRFRVLRPWLNMVHWHWRGKKRMLRNLVPLIRQAQLVVIGGGQLILDTELRFPLRIATTVHLAERNQAPVAFAACGSADRFSWIGRLLLRDALGSRATKHVSARDDVALANITRSFGGALRTAPQRTVDPAVWAREVYGFGQQPGANVVGLGIMAPHLLRRRAEDRDQFRRERVMQFWRELIARLRQSGHRVTLFCNGSETDLEFAREVAQGADCTLLPRPLSPAQLAWQIAQMKVCVAHRLHANILAFAMDVPSVGLIWDDKVRQFGRLSGRGDVFIEPADQTAENVAAAVETALKRPPDPAALTALKEIVRQDLQRLLLAAGLNPLP